MNIHFEYNIILLLLCVCLSGCNKNDSELPQEVTWKTSRIHITGLEATMSGTSALSLQGYLFESNILTKIYKGIEVQTDGTFELSNPGTGTVYFLSNSVALEALAALQVGTSTPDNLLSIETDELPENGNAEFFYSGTVEINPDWDNAALLHRSVAQLDLSVIPEGSDIKVTKVVLENVPVATKLFKGGSALPAVTRTLTFEGGIGSTDNIYRMYETDTAIDITIHALYKGTSRIIQARLGSVKRNFRYTLRVKDTGTNLNGMFEVEPWIDGDAAGSMNDDRIRLDQENSTHPSHVTISPPETITVIPNPVDVTNFTLAFSAPFEVVLDRVMGAGVGVTISKTETETISGTLVSKFAVSIPVTEMGTNGYLIELNLRAEDSSSFRRFYITIEKFN